MFDGAFEILTTSGVVLWSRREAAISPSIINSLITNVFIEERTLPGGGISDDVSAAQNPPYKTDHHTLKWTTVKELGIIFVAVYRSLLHLSWIDKLVDNIKTLFVDLYGEQLKTPHKTLVQCHEFDQYFDQQYLKLSGTAISPGRIDASDSAPSLAAHLDDEPPQLPGLLYRKNNNLTPSTDSTPIATPDTSPPTTPATGNNHLLTAKGGPGGKISRRARKNANNVKEVYPSSGEEFSGKKGKLGKTAAAKKGRKWNAEGQADEDSDTPLDYSEPANSGGSPQADSPSGAVNGVHQESWGTKTGKGQFVLKDLEHEVNSILSSADAKKSSPAGQSGDKGIVGSSISAIGGLFRNVVGGKVLTKEDLDKAMKGMEDHLLKKNVAREAAIRLCEGVERELIGVKTATFESISMKIHSAMEVSLQKILTPSNSLDLLRSIDTITKPSSLSLQKPRPYVISIVGVNGVGKSTNLSKIAYFLLQNKYKVLIVACDTFRSGAVEQLAVHVRNLRELVEREGGGEVDIYQKGYGKDAANVARDAVEHAGQNGFDVVLIDTAGRRHNDQRLMSSLEKFAKFANPDKIFMVGEALVGTDSVAQARNFNAAFGAGRGLDGFIISKCDTVGDMVGTLVSMVHSTGVPVLFVGVGQHYSDLRTLSVKWAVEKLLSTNST